MLIRSFKKTTTSVLSCASVLMFVASGSWAATLSGQVSAGEGSYIDGSYIEGAMITVRLGEPFQERTVFSGSDGTYHVDGLPDETAFDVRVRRIGWHDVRANARSLQDSIAPLDFTMIRHTDPALVAAQLPANRWYHLVLEQITDEREREQLVRQCTYCHQQGSAATRVRRDDEEWGKVLSLMARMGGGLDKEFRVKIPELFNSAYDPDTAIGKLTEGWQEPGFAPPPSAEVRRAVIDEYEVGDGSSMQHDMIVHPDGSAWSVDMQNDTLFRLDATMPGGTRESYKIPTDGLGRGGFDSTGALPSNSNMIVGPHSLQTDKDGNIWITLAIGNRLAKFDIATKEFTTFELPHGIYPHTLRLDGQGRIWYTIAVSNHVGVYDPLSGKHEVIRVPARSFGEGVMLRMLPALMKISTWFDLDAGGAGEGDSLPVPYGIDIAPDGGVWFSQLNAHKIGRIDPDTMKVRMVDTPFSAPRRMRFDSKGMLWIPGFSSNLIAKFDPVSGAFETIDLPIEPLGTETPYSINVDLKTDDVWICGTNSDTLIRYRQSTGAFSVYPLPTQVTYTRDIDFGADGSVWTSNSNAPAWQIETGIPRIIRLDPDGTEPERSARLEH